MTPPPAHVDAYVYGWPCSRGPRCPGYTTHRIVEFMINLAGGRVEVVGLCTRCGARADIPASALRRKVVEPLTPTLDLGTLMKGARRGTLPKDELDCADDRARTANALDAAIGRARVAAVFKEGAAATAIKARSRLRR